MHIPFFSEAYASLFTPFRKLKRYLRNLKADLVMFVWCRHIGDLFIISNPEKGDNKVEFAKWNKTEETRDFLGFTLGITIEKRRLE